MKTKKVLAFIAAMTLTFGTCSQPVFAEEAAKTETTVTETAEPEEAVATEETSGTVSFDEETYTLTLRGNVVKEEVKNYRDKNVVTIIAEEGTVLPEDCSGLFSNFLYLDKIDLSKADTSNVTNMGGMFTDCLSLRTLDLSNFDTSKVTDMSEMFNNCPSLISLDLSGFDTSNVKDFTLMFAGCQNLKTINVNKFDSSNEIISYSMFAECNSLVGGNGTAYDAENIDIDYARIDTPETPGYFTKKTVEAIVNDGDVECSLDENGVLTVRGKGEIIYSILDSSIDKDKIKSVVIKEGITKLPINSFIGCQNLESVSLPDTLTEISNASFGDCPELKTVNLPDSITRIGQIAFADTSITEITIPDSVESIDYGAFSHCKKLRKVTVGSSVKTIERDAFFRCDMLEEMTFKNPECELKFDRDSVFRYYFITIKGYKGSTAEEFAKEKLLNFEAIDSDYKNDYSIDKKPPYGGRTEDGIRWEIKSFSDDWTYLNVDGEGKIISAPWLKTDIDKIIYISISKKITEIGDGVFAGIDFEELIDVPDSVTTIGDHAFETKYSTDVTLGSSLSELKKDSIIVKPFINTLTVKNPDCVIEPSDSYDLYLLKVKGYEGSTAEELAKKYNVCFEAIDSDYKKDYSAERELPIRAKDMNGIEWEIDTTGTLTIIGKGEIPTPSWKKYKDKIKKVVVGEGITKLPKGAFYECENLVSVTLPDTLTEIGDNAFRKSVTINGYKGSYADEYAAAEDINFVALDNEDDILYGDANCNGTVDLSDAVLIMQAISNPSKYQLTEKGRENADCYNNGDGITGMDALAIQEYMLKIIDKLPLTIHVKGIQMTGSAE